MCSVGYYVDATCTAIGRPAQQPKYRTSKTRDIRLNDGMQMMLTDFLRLVLFWEPLKSLSFGDRRPSMIE